MSSTSTTARKPTNTGAPSVCKNLAVDPRVKEAFELAFKALYPDGKVDFGPVPTSQPPLGQVTPPPSSPGSGEYTQTPTAGGTVGADGKISTPGQSSQSGDLKYEYKAEKGGTAAIWVPEFGAGKNGGNDGSTGSGSAYFFGDSIAPILAGVNDSASQRANAKCEMVKGFAGAKGYNGQMAGGTDPAGILCYVKTHASKMGGKHIVISTGATNAPKLRAKEFGLRNEELSIIKQQLELISKSGATCTVVGVCDNFDGYGAQISGTGAAPETKQHAAVINQQLRDLAVEYKFEFTGPLPNCPNQDPHPYTYGGTFKQKYRNAGKI